MGFATEREVTCPHCGKGTMQYVDTAKAKGGSVKCKRCGKVVHYDVPSYGELNVRESSVQRDLIQLGYQKPELREHLRPVLAHLEKTSKIHLDYQDVSDKSFQDLTKKVLLDYKGWLIFALKDKLERNGYSVEKRSSLSAVATADNGTDVWFSFALNKQGKHVLSLGYGTSGVAGKTVNFLHNNDFDTIVEGSLEAILSTLEN